MTDDPDADGVADADDAPNTPDAASRDDGDQVSREAAGEGVDEPAEDSLDEPVPAETDPSAYTTGRRSISPRVQVIWGLQMLVGVLLLSLGATYLSAVLDPLPSWFGQAVGLVLLAVGLAWVRRRHQVWVYEIREDSLYLERGVVTHVRTIAPFVGIQHVDTQRGPLERWLGLSTLVVYTAGTRGADVSIPGLSPEEARDLQGRVKELAIEAEGGDAV